MIVDVVEVKVVVVKKVVNIDVSVVVVVGVEVGGMLGVVVDRGVVVTQLNIPET